ncbi:SNF2 family N-terminal domain-containing protein [Suillus ampliporus]|nr:SNF2 family N-terminal domain-containing protein [Suillus ampliporus]
MKRLLQKTTKRGSAVQPEGFSSSPGAITKDCKELRGDRSLLQSPRRTTNVTLSASKSTKSVRLSSAPKNLKNEEIAPPIGTNVARDFWHQGLKLCQPNKLQKKPKSIDAANNMNGWSVPSCSSPILFEHQAMVPKWLLAREKAGQGGSILAHEMGLGKTITSIALINNTLHESKDSVAQQKRPLINRRQHLCLSASNGCAKSKDLAMELTVKVHEGHMDVDALMDADVIASHYVSGNRTSNEQGSQGSGLLARWFRVILDESHKIIGVGAWYKACLALKKLQGLCLTGTPFVNKLSDVQPQLKFLEVRDESGPSAECTAYKDLLATCMRYRRKVDVMQLPNLDIKTVPVWQTKRENMTHDWARSSIRGFDMAWIRARQGDVSVYVYSAQIVLIVFSLACNHPFLLLGVLGQIVEQGLDPE